MASTAVKLNEELIEAARTESAVRSRSMTQQIEYWARIGRAVERTGAISQDRVRAALVADIAYDELGTAERMAVLGQLERAVFHPNGDSDLARHLLSLDIPLSTVDENGHVVAATAE